MQLAYDNDCEIIHAGDLFHHWKPSPNLLSLTISRLLAFTSYPIFYTVYGQHDLPQHNIELSKKSGIYTLNIADSLNTLEKGHWGEEPGPHTKNMAVWHKFTWDGKHWPWPDCPEQTAEEVLDKYPQFDLIVTGDYHKGFTYEKDGRLLVNPGCLTRQTADYADYRPRVYLWYAEDNTVEPVFLPIEKDAVSREHIEYKEKHDRRIEAFVERLNDEWDTTVSFEENLNRFFSQNDIKKPVKDIIYQSIEK
jgi:DNA repair exonuclease SbcCD nuclease subunit